MGVEVGAPLQVRLQVRPGGGLSDTGRSPVVPRSVSAAFGKQVQRGRRHSAAGRGPLSARWLLCSPVCMHRLAMVTSSPVSQDSVIAELSARVTGPASLMGPPTWVNGMTGPRGPGACGGAGGVPCGRDTASRVCARRGTGDAVPVTWPLAHPRGHRADTSHLTLKHVLLPRAFSSDPLLSGSVQLRKWDQPLS